MNDSIECHPVPFAYESLTKDVSLKSFNRKVVVSDYGLAHWLAANSGVDINDWRFKND